MARALRPPGSGPIHVPGPSPETVARPVRAAPDKGTHLMIRARFVSMTISVGLLFVCGCCCFSLPERPWFGRHRECCSNGEMIASGGSPVITEGPILMDSGPPTYAGPSGTILNAPAPTNAPQLSPPPRLYPQQAQPTPYQPTNRRGT